MFDEITHPQQRAFLTAYSECGVVKEAAEAVGISREVHYDWLQNETYGIAWERAREMAADTLEDEARSRTRVQKSDKLLMFLLERLKPNVFGKKIEHTHKRYAIDWSQYSDEELALLERLANKSGALGSGSDPGGDGTAPGEEAGPDVSGPGEPEA